MSYHLRYVAKAWRGFFIPGASVSTNYIVNGAYLLAVANSGILQSLSKDTSPKRSIYVRTEPVQSKHFSAIFLLRCSYATCDNKAGNVKIHITTAIRFVEFLLYRTNLYS